MKKDFKNDGVNFLNILTIAVAFASFGLAPVAQAVVPAPNGGYPGFNTAEGTNALKNLTTGVGNTAVGWYSLFTNTDGSFNTALGAGALLLNIGDQNTQEGIQNTAIGAAALLSNATGQGNTANGAFALFSNTAGAGNTANGNGTLYSNSIGSANTAYGSQALGRNTTGGGNTAVGYIALYNNTTGNNNIALGDSAGYAVTTADSVIAIGTVGANVSNSCYIGHIFGASVDPGSALNVMVDVNGKLGTVASSKRFKEQIRPMDKSSEALLSLKPVTFRYRNYKKSPAQFGLIAEEVAAVNPDLVARDKNGEIYTVRYDQINAMLLNEFLKEHKKVERLEATLEAVNARLQEQAAQIQKVSAQVEAMKPLSHLVQNNR